MKSKLLLICTVFLTTLSIGQTIPTASFSTSSSTLCAKSSIQITDLSANVPTAWSYSVNGVLTSTVQNPEIVFPVAGTYSIDLEATNGSGTSSVFSETILVVATPTVTISGNTLVCSGATSTLSASGADTYSWVSGPTSGTITINPTSNTNYTLVGTSTVTGCMDSAFAFITTIGLPTISVNNATICLGTTYTITPTGASTYSYSGGSNAVTPTISTIYTVSGTDAQTGCSDSVLVLISVSAPSVAANGGSLCSGQSFTIVPSGATTYTYSSGNNVVSPTVTTIYTVSGTDGVTGCTNSVSVLVSVLPSPTIGVNSGTLCAGSVFTIVPTGATNYTFVTGSNTVAPTTSTTYIVSGTDPNTGCPGFATVSLTVSPLPAIVVNSGTICIGDVFTITPTGASTYTISGGSATVAPIISSTYSITGTSAQGCISQSAVISTVTVAGVKPVVTISASVGSVICIGDVLVLTASGASSYSWNTGAITASILISPTVTSIFAVTGTDGQSGCTGGASFLQYVMECTGIEDNQQRTQILVYPNPATTDLNIETSHETQLFIINNLGQIILKKELTAGKNVIDLDDKPTGIYFVYLNYNSELKAIRIIKN